MPLYGAAVAEPWPCWSGCGRGCPRHVLKFSGINLITLRVKWCAITILQMHRMDFSILVWFLFVFSPKPWCWFWSLQNWKTCMPMLYLLLSIKPGATQQRLSEVVTISAKWQLIIYSPSSFGKLKEIFLLFIHVLFVNKFSKLLYWLT